MTNAVAVAASEQHEARKVPFWAKCSNPACGHCWAAAYTPMPLAEFARVTDAARFCPKCAAPKPVVAKQSNGELLEPQA